jgi:hypothetical protein
MNREFNAASTLVRSILAAAAVLSTLLVVGSIEGLAQHYSAGMQAVAPSAVIAQR